MIASQMEQWVEARMQTEQNKKQKSQPVFAANLQKPTEVAPGDD